ncbi:MAG: TIGR00341 family protein [Paludibacteraceae bacterium]|nr:TIGR00341 family protein [Paludibacteraceae bacterium]
MIRETLRAYLSLDQDKIEDTEVIESIVSGTTFKGANLWILVCAILIASLGLNMNSTAVIIGAMLISPLMGPIMGMGLGMGINDGDLIIRCLKNLAVATAFAVATSALYFVLSPISDVRSELLARTQPTIYDVMIAFFGGFAGIITTCSKSKGNILPGVAIATALMPPLCTVGYGLATLQWQFVYGAFYLFLINAVYIGFATWLGVRILRIPKHKAEEKHSILLNWSWIIVLVIFIPSIFTTYQIVRKEILGNRVTQFLNGEFGENKDIQVVNHNYLVGDSINTIEVTVVGKSLTTEEINLIEAHMGTYNLADHNLKVVQSSPLESEKDKLLRERDLVKTWFNDMHARSLSMQSENDSLRHEIKNMQQHILKLKEENKKIESERQAAIQEKKKAEEALQAEQEKGKKKNKR